MKRRRTPTAARPSLATTTSSKLLATDDELTSLRREYAGRPRDERRKAADWSYESACANELFSRALGKQSGQVDAWSGYLSALAIDPDHAPAMLTVGAIEYGLGRVRQAMSLLLRLLELVDEEDLPEIVDKAGDFLIDQDDLVNAERLYAAATELHPQVAIFHIGLGYCAGKAERFEEAVRHTRRAVELEPGNYLHLSDLGYSLTQAGHYDEAERVLCRAIELAPPDYEMARGNLEHLREVRTR